MLTEEKIIFWQRNLCSCFSESFLFPTSGWGALYKHLTCFVLLNLLLFAAMALKKSARAQNTDAVRQAILDQFNRVPRPSPDKALKDRNFSTWWDRF